MKLKKSLLLIFLTSLGTFLRFHSLNAAPIPCPHEPGLTVIQENDILHKESLGEGNFGKVYLTKIRNINFEQPIVIKTFQFTKPRGRILRKPNLDLIQKERDRQQLASQADVAPQLIEGLFCIQYVEQNYELGFGMQLLEHSMDLEKAYNFLKMMSNDQQKSFFSQLVRLSGERLTQLHQIGLTHQDLAPKNVLISWDRNLNQILDLKIIDYGMMSDDVGHPEYHIKDHLTYPVEIRDWIALSNVLIQGIDSCQIVPSLFDRHSAIKKTLSDLQKELNDLKSLFGDIFDSFLNQIK